MVVIPAGNVVLDERTLMKCQVPLCSHYGVDLMCPPNVLPVSKFKGILECYQSAILVKVDIPSSAQPGTVTEDYLNTARDAKKRFHEIVSKVESLCFAEGYYFAAGLVGGSCPLCEECVGVKSGLPCRHPFRARPAMEAMGIDVISTARKAGLDLSFSKNESRSWVGLVLVA